jgi:serine O-acetyltransferase
MLSDKRITSYTFFLYPLVRAWLKFHTSSVAKPSLVIKVVHILIISYANNKHSLLNWYYKMVISRVNRTTIDMEKKFYQHIFEEQQNVETVPPNDKIASWALQLICLLFPEKSECFVASAEQVEDSFNNLEAELIVLLNATKACPDSGNKEKARKFFSVIPEMYRVLNTDIDAIVSGDPAARTRFEVVRAYPGFYAISFYRIAHALTDLDIPILPRILTEHAHSKTGIDIHPCAEIGEHFFIDHGTGIVIGETCIIGDYVKLYQGATLGALSVDKNMAFSKRHPTVEDHVIIYSGATILGGDTIIGHHSIIGGNVWLTQSLPPYSTVYHRAENEVIEQNRL